MGNCSSASEEHTVAAYTLYGFGCSRCSSHDFRPGAPTHTCCGIPCTSVQFNNNDVRYDQIKPQLEASLPDAAKIAHENIDKCCNFVCALCDLSADTAAAELNRAWCPQWNEQLQSSGLRCVATSEIHGFGRSAVNYLVIRVIETRNP
jgi:hypothetical protein